MYSYSLVTGMLPLPRKGGSAPYLNSEQSVGVKEREPLFELFVNLIL